MNESYKNVDGPQNEIYIISGGTTMPIAPHFSICSEAYGTIGSQLDDRKDRGDFKDKDVYFIETKMARGRHGLPLHIGNRLKALGWDKDREIKTNDDVSDLVDLLVKNRRTRCIVMAAALCDFKPEALLTKNSLVEDFGSHMPRLHGQSNIQVSMGSTEKIINKIRKTRKDIFLVSFKASSNLSDRELYIQALHNLKSSSSNLVFANDISTETNMIVTPEEYFYKYKRKCAIAKLAKMIDSRTACTFTRSTVVDGKTVDWSSDKVPSSLRQVVNHCIDKKAYKPFRNATVGHFAFDGDDGFIYTSIRKSNFNEIDKVGLVRVEAVGNDKVIAYGAKPSVGGQSQRIIFKEHKDVNCIVHFHCPMKENSKVPVASQWQNECGSHECGMNTSNNMKEMLPGIKAVMLEGHGPNIIFNRDIDPQTVIDFIEDNWSLSEKTGGFVEAEAFA